MPEYTITQYNVSPNDESDWIYHFNNAPADGDILKLGNALGTGTPLDGLSAITITTGVTFDGQGYAVNTNITGFAGALILTGGTIQNLSVSNSGTLANKAGHIVSGTTHNGSVYNCHADGTIDGTDSGGIVGKSESTSVITIERCTTSGNITGNLAGGIKGYTANANSQITINECYATGNVSGGNRSGGICGAVWRSSSMTISDCYYWAV